MSIYATPTVTSTGTIGTQSSTQQTLGKEDFLSLLITQMQNQDPLDPMDNSQFLAQMAQFSALEQMQNLNTSFENSLQLTQSLNNTAAASFIGMNVRASGDEITLGSSGSAELGYFLSEDAKTVTISIVNSDGETVRALVADETTSGAHRLNWDGRDLDGNRLEPGSYTFSISATNADGEAVTATSVVNGVVDGVTYQNGIAYLLVDDRQIPLSEVLEIYK